MSTLVDSIVGTAIRCLLEDQSEWSQKTFGSDDKRGPVGVLKHLKKEAQECIDSPRDLTELADCQLLIMDANRRSGFTFMELIVECRRKLEINKLREWPAPSDDDEPVHHVQVKPEFKRIPDAAGVWVQYFDGSPHAIVQTGAAWSGPTNWPRCCYFGPIPWKAE